MESLPIIIDKLFLEEIESLSKEYKDLKSQIRTTDYSSINTKINNRLESVKTLELKRALLLGSILKLTGSDEKSLLLFFTTYLTEKISIKQFNFIEYSIFNHDIPFSSDIVFDLTEYILFDQKSILKKAGELIVRLEDDFNKKTLLFLFFLSCRHDLSNENRELIFLILQNFTPKDVVNLLKKDFFIGSIKYKKNISILRSRKQKNPVPYSRTSPRGETNIKKASDQESFSSKTKTMHEAKLTLENKHAALWESIKIPTFSDKVNILRHPRDLFRSRDNKDMNISSKQTAGKTVKKSASVDKKDIPSTTSEERRGFQFINIIRKKYIYIISFFTVAFLFILIFAIIPKRFSENSSFYEKGEPVFIHINHQNKHTENKVQMEPEEKIGTAPHELYTIVEGDTLSHISKRYYNNASMYNVLSEENNLENPDRIFPGQTIVIPEFKP